MTSYRGHRGPFRVGLLVFAVASWRLLLTTGTETDTLPSPSIGGEHSNSNDGPLKSDTVSPGIAQVASTGTRSPQDDSSDGNGRNPQSSGSRANAVWGELLEARGHPPCSNPPFKEGLHKLEDWADLGEEMSHVQGAVVIRRPDLVDADSPSSLLAPAKSVNYVPTLQSYFSLFKSSFIPGMMLEEHKGLKEEIRIGRFLDAVRQGDDSAGVYLSANWVNTDEVAKRANGSYESIPTVTSMADVYFNSFGFFWNDKDSVVPNACLSRQLGNIFNRSVPLDIESFEKVVVLTQGYGDSYYHFVVESLSRLPVVLDVLKENPDIQVAVPRRRDSSKEYIYQFLELLGVARERVRFVRKVHAGLAIIPSSTVCFRANAAPITMLRHALLQELYPSTGGVVPTLDHPVIVLIVRTARRGLKNNDDVREALKLNFPEFRVVEFSGADSIRSQLKIFATASVIVGPHGAGLANMIASPLRTPILEIAPTNCPSCFLTLAVKLQHIYARHPGGNQWNDTCSFFYEPPVDEVVDLVRNLLVAKRQADAAAPP